MRLVTNPISSPGGALSLALSVLWLGCRIKLLNCGLAGNQAAALLPVAWSGLAGYRQATTICVLFFCFTSSGLTRLH